MKKALTDSYHFQILIILAHFLREGSHTIMKGFVDNVLDAAKGRLKGEAFRKLDSKRLTFFNSC